MYHRTDFAQLSLIENTTTFTVELNAENRWIKLAEIIPWDKIDEHYASNMCEDNGRDGITSRIAFGAIYSKEVLHVTDEGILEAIIENVYLQYFLGLQNYNGKKLFDSSMMVHFRSRFTKEFIAQINEYIATGMWPGNDDISPDDLTPPDDENVIENKGQLTLDATVAPADICHPNDVRTVKECREYCETLIDILWEYVAQKDGKKTPYHRDNANKKFNKYILNKKKTKAKNRKALEQQLIYLEMAIQTVSMLLLALRRTDFLYDSEWGRFDAVCKIYLQQKFMLDNDTCSCENKIMNLRQPHVRAIFRGKAGKRYEYGQKLALSKANGYVFIEKMSWDNFNECLTLQQSVADYFRRFGCYPEVVLADKIYHTNDNKKFCKKYKIRLGGIAETRKNITEIEREIALDDYRKRNEIEGVNGVLKRKHGLDLISSWTRHNAEIEAALNILDINLQRRLRFLFAFLFEWLFEQYYKWKIVVFQ